MPSAPASRPSGRSVPLAASHAVGLAVFSYDGDLFFCLNVDRDSCRDIDVLRDGIESSIRS